ncbi:MAG: FAD-dependent monooxygenase [Devosiaceae bacterium]|nr:FAD-dependent monooxygenase [Devosiaceae bacterium MH13]
MADDIIYDCAVVGTGPSGMIAALAAAHAGLTSVLVGPPINEKDKRTTALLGPSLDVLAGLGLSEAIDALGTPLRTMRLIDGSRRLIRSPVVSFDAEEMGEERFGLNCPNAQLNAALLDAARKSETLTIVNATAADYRPGGSEVQVVLRDGAILRARAVLAADGRNSPARQAVGVGARRWAYPQSAAVGVLQHTRPHDFISTELHTETGPYTFVPMPDGEDGSYRSSFVCALSPEHAKALAQMDLQEASSFLQDRSMQVLGALSLEAPVQVWPLEALVADRFAAQGIFLIGEAAHAFPPIGAQGLNLSVRDATTAVGVVQRALASGTALSDRRVAMRYDAKRRADIWSRTLGVDALNRSLLTSSPLAQIGRAAALGATRLSPTYKSVLMRAGLEPVGPRAVAERVIGRLQKGLPRPPFARPRSADRAGS